MIFDVAMARRYAGRALQPGDSYHAEELLLACDRIEELEGLLREMLTDFDRRRATHRGRVLLWLLRKVT